MANCEHGFNRSHYIDTPAVQRWCAGPGNVGPHDLWRGQLEFQMNAHPIGIMEHNEPLRHQRLTDDELATVKRLHEAIRGPASAAVYRDYIDNFVAPKFRIDGATTGRFASHQPPLTQRLRDRGFEVFTVDASKDRLSEFIPQGWFASWGERWYDVPIYNSVVADLGFDPLFVKG